MFRTTVEELFAQVNAPIIDPNLIEIPQDRSKGDFALPCFSFAKEMKLSPQLIAQQIGDQLMKDIPNKKINKLVVDGPYINVTLDNAYVADTILKEILEKKETYGRSKSRGEKIAIESPGPNTNKPLHLGHVRNMLIGNALALMGEFAGFDIVKVDIKNDRGVHICKSLLAYEKFGNKVEPDKKPDHFVGDWYVRYALEAKKDPNLDIEIQDMLVKREQGDPEVRALRDKMRTRCLQGIEQTYARYGCHIDQSYSESDHYLKGRKIVDDGIASGMFIKNDKGHYLFQDEELGDKIVLRSDGTSIYITQDLALGILRYDDWKMDRMVYIVGNEQADHFKFLFKIFESMGLEFASNCHHLSYGMISLPDGKMKSREGNVVDADSLIDEMQEASLVMLEKRYPGEDMKTLAEDIAFAAIKFFVLKYDAKKDFVFDRNESLSFDGESGPYLQYTHARCMSILKKSETSIKSFGEIDLSPLELDSERMIMLHLSELGSIVEKAADEYKPSLVARYVLDLARLFNTYYQHTKILVEDDSKVSDARLALVQSVQYVLNTGLGLLGIQAPKKM